MARTTLAHLIVGETHITMYQCSYGYGVLDETIDEDGYDHPHSDMVYDTPAEAWEAFTESVVTLTPYAKEGQ